METHSPVYAIGDVHGEYKKLLHLLHINNIIDKEHHWCAKNASLWFIGDLVDRGPDGIGVIELLMRLQNEATAVGGSVGSLMGNHDLMLLAAYQLGRRSTGLGSSFIRRWRQSGGKQKDIASLTKHHLDWLTQLPFLVNVNNTLLIHADSPFYLQYGRTLEDTEQALHKVLRFSDALAWEELIENFTRRGAFLHTYGGEALLQRFLDYFGGQRIVHGHTPIHLIQGGKTRNIHEPLIYAEGRCINIDGGLCLGGPGFVYRLD